MLFCVLFLNIFNAQLKKKIYVRDGETLIFFVLFCWGLFVCFVGDLFDVGFLVVVVCLLVVLFVFLLLFFILITTNLMDT